MKNYTCRMLFLSVFCFAFFSFNLQAQFVISGPDPVCSGDTATYGFPFISPPEVTYHWSVTGGYVNYSNINFVSITWTTAGTGTVHLTVINRQTGGVHLTSNLNVTVLPKPVPFISDTSFAAGSSGSENHTVFCMDETENGHEPEDDDCHAVCTGVQLGYTTPLNSGSTYLWSSIGHQGGNGQLNNHYMSLTWSPLPPSVGQVTVTETDANGCVGHAELCIKKLDEPIVSFTNTATLSPGPVYSACEGQKIYFTSTASDDVVSWHWDFGDGTISTDENPTHTYTTGGSYIVTFTVVNECGCSNSTEADFEIEPAITLDIVCVGTVCQGDSARYKAVYSDPGFQGACTDFSWSITGGQILSGQGTDSVLVRWLNPSSGYGTLTLQPQNCPPDICSYPTSVKVPIITSVTMKGDDTPCINTQSFYSIPAQPGARFRWTVTGGTIVGGSTTRGPEANLSEIAVNWGSSGGSHSVSVIYGNAPLNCQYSTSMNVTLLDSFYVSGPTQVCVGPTYTYQATAGGTYTWRILDKNGVLVLGPFGSGASLSFPSSGEYFVEAEKTSGTFCNEIYRYAVKSIETPPAPDTIFGDLVICPETYYDYRAASAGADYVIKWIFTGANIDSAFGERATVSWNTGQPSYSIKVVHHAIESPYCASDTLTIPIVQKPNPIPVILGDVAACVSNFTVFSTNKIADEYRWNVLPVTAGSISGQFTSSIQVEWHEDPGIATVRLEAKVCNDVAVGTKNVNVLAAPTPTISTSTAYYCEGRLETFNVNPGSGATHFTWDFGDGSGEFTDTSPTPKTHKYERPGNYNVTVDVLYNGQTCPGPYTATFPITVNPEPVVRLSAEIDPLICPPDTVPQGPRGGGGMWLDASVYGTSAIANYDVAWYTVDPGSGSPTSTITLSGLPYYQATTYDSYRIRITDKTSGCLGWSNIVTVDTCNGNTHGGSPLVYPDCTDSIPTGIDFTFSLDTSQCGKVDFTPLLGANRVFYSFEFDDNSGLSTNYTHYFDRSGIYQVRMIVLQTDNGDTCVNSIVKPVTVPFYGKMSYNLVCNKPNMLVDLKTDHNFVDQATPDKPNYFGFYLNPAVGANPKGLGQVALPPGTYQVDMKSLNTSTGSMCYIKDSIIVPEPGVADFTVSSGPYCQKSPIGFTNTSTGTILKNSWDFGDFSESTLGSPSREYPLFSSLNGEFTDRFVTLVTTDHIGCKDTLIKQVRINDHLYYDNQFFGINPSLAPPFCEGDSVQLGITPVPSVTYSDYLWSTGATTSTIYSKATGSYWADVTDIDGCRNITDLASTGALPSPGARIIGDRTYCLGEEVRLNAWRGDSYTYTWYKGNPAVQIGTDPLLKDRPAKDSTYIYIIKLDDGTCTDYDTAFVEILKLPEVSIDSTEGVCAADAPLLTATAIGGGPFKYKWNNGDQGNQTQVVNAGMYAVEATDTNGCRQRTHIDIIPRADFKNLMTGCYKFCEDDLNIVIQGMGVHYSDVWVDADGVSHNGSPYTISSSSSTVDTLKVHTTHNSSQCKDTSETLTYQIIPSASCNELIPRLKPYGENENGDYSEPETVGFTVEIAPNPANDRTSINYMFEKQENNRIVVVDSYHRKVKEYNNLGNVGNLQLNTAELSGGLYLVMIISGDVLQIRKLVVTH